MNHLGPKKQKSSANYCERAAFTLVDTLIQGVEADAKQHNGWVYLDTLKAVVERLKTGESDALAVFREIRDDCLRQHEREIWDKARRRPFDRALVKRFSHLFPSEGQLDQDDRLLSRRMLPGFFTAFEMLAGPEIFRRCHDECGLISDRLRQEHGHLDWQDLYDDPEANALVDDALIDISVHFVDFEHRFEWLQTMLRGHMAGAQDYAFEGRGVGEWNADDATVYALLEALFLPLGRYMSDASALQRIADAHGPDAVEALRRVLGALENAR